MLEVQQAKTAVNTAKPWINLLQKAHEVNFLRESLQLNNQGIVPAKLTKIAILGASDEGIRLAELCKKNNIEISAWVDDNPERVGKECFNRNISPSEALKTLDKNIPVILATHRVLDSSERIKQWGFHNVAPFALLQCLSPEIFTPHMFYENWLEDLIEHKREILDLQSLFNDNFSIQVLNSVLGYRMTCDPSVLDDVIEWELYGPNDLLSYSDDEVYIDGGTFDGDSIKLFIDRVDNKFDKIYGFEPDTNTFQKLKANFSHESRVIPINKGLYSHDTTLHFDNAGTRGSILTEQATAGGVNVPVTNIDNIVNGERVSYIKMNIEGAEIAALNGARETITKHNPKLAISVYHRASDLWEIPMLVKKLNSQYDLYLRQHDRGVIETVLYAFKK